MQFTSIFLIAASGLANVIMETASGFAIGPLTSCGGASDILALESVVLSPYPIQKGKDIKITASGVLAEALESGAYAKMDVKLGFIPILSQNFDICEEAAKSGKSCPLAKGTQSIEVSKSIPGSVPSATINVEIHVFTKDNKQVSCLSGKLKIQ